MNGRVKWILTAGMAVALFGANAYAAGPKPHHHGHDRNDGLALAAGIVNLVKTVLTPPVTVVQTVPQRTVTYVEPAPVRTVTYVEPAPVRTVTYVDPEPVVVVTRPAVVCRETPPPPPPPPHHPAGHGPRNGHHRGDHRR